MRIAHIVPTYLPATRYGGPIYSVHGLCRGLAELGHEVHVFTTSVDGPTDSAVPHGVPVDVDGVRVWYFRSRRLRRLYYAPDLRATLLKQLSGFDVVHLHSVYLWPTNMAARACQRAGVPYVLSPRGMLVSDLIARKNRWLKLAWLRLIEARTLRGAARLHYTSTRERVEAERLYPALREAGCIVPNGVVAPFSVPPLSAALRNVVGAGPYCLFLGRVHWVKGIDRLLRAVAGTNIRLVVCGNDEEGYAAQVDALVDSLGIGSQVVRLAPVHGDDKWALLAAAYMLVLPSMSENFGNVVPEAMAMACPVVTTHGVGAAEVVEAARGGLVCGPDERELRGALLRLWNDDALRAEMSALAKNYVEQHLQWSSVAQGMVDCYKRLERSPRPTQ